MINAWKIRRELARLGQQGRALAEWFTEPARQRAYDRDRLAHLHLTPGAQPPSATIALFVIYQPRGLAASVLHTCRHLIASGYAPFVVSNGPLAEPDRTALAGLCWKLAERPNYGYDFGGYRDGILALLDWGTPVETLLVLNDSIWFPLYDGDTLIPRLHAAPGGIAGTILRRRKAPLLLRRNGPEIRFLESYLYRISADAFRHPAFAAYWRGYLMTDNKYKVIRRGERDFSLSMQAAGIATTPLFTAQTFLACVTAQSTADLAKTIRYAAHADEPLARRQQTLAASPADTPDWRAQALGHINATLMGGVFNSAFCYPTLTGLRAGYLKKSPERINRLWRARFLQAVAAGDLPEPAPALLAEISAADNP